VNQNPLEDMSNTAELTVNAMQKAGITKEQLREAIGFPEDYVKAMVKEVKEAKDRSTGSDKIDS